MVICGKKISKLLEYSSKIIEYKSINILSLVGFFMWYFWCTDFLTEWKIAFKFNTSYEQTGIIAYKLYFISLLFFSVFIFIFNKEHKSKKMTLKNFHIHKLLVYFGLILFFIPFCLMSVFCLFILSYGFLQLIFLGK